MLTKIYYGHISIRQCSRLDEYRRYRWCQGGDWKCGHGGV